MPLGPESRTRCVSTGRSQSTRAQRGERTWREGGEGGDIYLHLRPLCEEDLASSRADVRTGHRILRDQGDTSGSVGFGGPMRWKSKGTKNESVRLFLHRGPAPPPQKQHHHRAKSNITKKKLFYLSFSVQSRVPFATRMLSKYALVHLGQARLCRPLGQSLQSSP